MERFQGHKPPKYQLGFDFGAQLVEPPTVEELRFTYAVQETVKVRTPADAGHYLLTQVYTRCRLRVANQAFYCKE